MSKGEVSSGFGVPNTVTVGTYYEAPQLLTGHSSKVGKTLTKSFGVQASYGIQAVHVQDHLAIYIGIGEAMQ